MGAKFSRWKREHNTIYLILVILLPIGLTALIIFLTGSAIVGVYVYFTKTKSGKKQGIKIRVKRLSNHFNKKIHSMSLAARTAIINKYDDIIKIMKPQYTPEEIINAELAIEGMMKASVADQIDTMIAHEHMFHNIIKRGEIGEVKDIIEHARIETEWVVLSNEFDRLIKTGSYGDSGKVIIEMEILIKQLSGYGKKINRIIINLKNANTDAIPSRLKHYKNQLNRFVQKEIKRK